MEPETKPSSFARISPWLRRLRDRAVSLWKSLPSLFSKLRTPLKKLIDSVNPKAKTQKKETIPPEKPPVIPNVVPPPPRDGESEKRRYPNTPWWKILLEVIGVAAGVALVIITGFYTHYAKQQRDAMLESNKINRESLESIQRAFITFRTIINKRDSKETPTGIKWGFTFGPIVENSGTTPAPKAIGFVNAHRLFTEPDNVTFKGSASEYQIFPIGTKATQGLGPLYRTDMDIFGRDLDPKNLDGLTTNFFVWGWVCILLSNLISFCVGNRSFVLRVPCIGGGLF